MEIANNSVTFDNSEAEDIIKVRAIISCPSGDYKKKFKNVFLRKDMELLIVSLKIFDFLTCSKCGELLNLNLVFEI